MKQWLKCCLAVVLGLAGAAQAQVVLVDDGRPGAVIVTADEPAPVAAYAARELADHVELATGVRMSILGESQAQATAAPAGRVHVGPTRASLAAGIDAASLPAEVAIIRTDGQALHIVGREGSGDPLNFNNHLAGTLWGVYELLETQLGVRWLWPGELGTFVPRTRRVVVPALDQRIQPHFELRHLRPISRGNDPRYGFTEPGRLRYIEAETIFLRRHRMGRSHESTPYNAGHSFTNWHTQYGQEHPEWFLLRADGTRGSGARATMCVTNPELHAQIVSRFAESQRKKPQAGPVISIGENDGHQLCQCTRCRAWDDPPAGDEELAGMVRYVQCSMRQTGGARYARFWQALYPGLRRVNPDVKATAFVYSHYFAAPQSPVELNENIILAFVPWMPHPLPLVHTLEPTTYGRSVSPGRAWFFPRHDQEQQWVMRQWDLWRATGATLYYRPNHTLGGYAMPLNYARQFATVFQHYAANGLKGTNFDSLVGQWSAQGTTMYLHARLHTRPHDDVDRLLDEYYQAFGPAAGQVAAYFDYWESHTLSLLDGRIETALVRHGGGSMIDTYARIAYELFPPPAFAAAEKLLDAADAAAAASDDPRHGERVSFLRDGLTHARLCADASALFADPAATPRQRHEARVALGRFRQSVEDRFIANYHWFTSRQESKSWSAIAGFEDE